MQITCPQYGKIGRVVWAEPNMPARPTSSRLPALGAILGLAILRLVTGRGSTRSDRVPAPPRTPAERQQDHGPSNSAPPSNGAGRERDRGRDATTPIEIPTKGWKDILWRTYEENNKDRILAVAAGVTFYGLLALSPAIAVWSRSTACSPISGLSRSI